MSRLRPVPRPGAASSAADSTLTTSTAGNPRAPSEAWPTVPSESVAKRLRGGDWPRTGRVMPWLVAVYLGMLFLVPFDSTELPISLPIDSKLDRVALVILGVAWLASLLSSRSSGPRFGRNRLAMPILLLLFVALASDAVNLEMIARLDLLDLAIKKQALLLSYVVFFFIVVTTVRPSEVRSYSVLLVGLAVVTALGTIWEYRTDYNVFYDLTDALIPGAEVQEKALGLDASGRRNITGPAAHGLAATTLLALVLPIALLGLLESRDRRRKLLYGAAVVLIAAGTLSTGRKSAVFIPLGAGIALLAYRPRASIRLLPLMVVLVPAIHVLAPEAMGGIRSQLFPKQGSVLDQPSTTGRTEDYAAVNPDIRSHMVLGRGYGTYDPDEFRLLDNQYLGVLLQTGFIGLGIYVLLLVSVAWVAHPTIRRGGPVRGPPALAATCSVGALLVGSALFDALAFPQVPYTFLFIAAMVAVLAAEPVARAAPAKATMSVRMADGLAGARPAFGSAQTYSARRPTEAP